MDLTEWYLLLPSNHASRIKILFALSLINVAASVLPARKANSGQWKAEEEKKKERVFTFKPIINAGTKSEVSSSQLPQTPLFFSWRVKTLRRRKKERKEGEEEEEGMEENRKH